MGKDKSKSKDKDKKRKRDKSEDEGRKKQKAEKMAKELTARLKRRNGEAAASGNVAAPRFVWTKKIEKDLAQGVDVHEFSRKAEHRKHEERLEEIQKVQRRREEREAEKLRMEEELQFIQRERLVAEGVELDKKEELFHLEQAKMRTEQRLREGRPKPVDQVVKHLYFPNQFDDEDENGEEQTPTDAYAYCRTLTLPELRDLRHDITNYQELDKYDQQHVKFWDALATVVDHELTEAQRQEELDRARVRGEAPPPHLMRREAGWHASIDTDVSSMLAGKTRQQLLELEDSINQQLDSDAVADPDYWTAVLSRLGIWKARSQLRELHADILAKHVASADAAVNVAAEMGWDREAREEAEQDAAPAASPATEQQELLPEPAAESSEDEDAALERLARPPDDTGGAAPPAPEAAYRSDGDGEEREENVGQWSPAPLDPAMVAGQDVIHEDDDSRLLDLLRAQVKQKEASKYRRAAVAGAAGGASEGDRAYQQMVADPASQHGGVHPMMRNLTDAAPQRGDQAFRSGRQQQEPESEAERAFKSTASRIMGDPSEQGDVAFGGELQLESQVYWWHEKYRPRKPKYFNRVHTGYEWNKYNQTHYDHDNPPPKTVQGYKFNIFYPDLIDKTEAPTFACEKDPEAVEGSTCLLRFHAGPPYEDLAFRIVNKEWEYSHKRGFKSTFERGIMHLYFNFKRARYRR